MRLLSALALTIAAACALAFASCKLGDGAPEPPVGADGGGVGAHNPSGDGGTTGFPDAGVFPADSGTIGPPGDAF
jgi:hypothetical protein